ncbi:MAG TPA: hypothetical protein VHJ78_13950 [Actinomycetota bacterium]|nr:hypothetical protein [Actinomycetota bacterium]
MRKLSRTQIVAGLIAVFVLATLAVAFAAAQDGDEEQLELKAQEPAASATSPSAEPAQAADQPAVVVDPMPAGRSGGSSGTPVQPPAARPVSPPSGPDTPVSSADSPPPAPVIVSDPPSAFGGIRTFEDCAAAGYPIAESYPEQCRTPDGRLFVRVVD